jgi:hypothetical protein
MAPGGVPYDIKIVTEHATHGGRALVDYLLLPLRLYFGQTVEYSLGRPSLLFLLLPIYLWLPKQRVVTALLGLALIHIVIWSQGAQAIRYLTSAMPELSIATAYVLCCIGQSARFAGRGRAVSGLLLVGGLIVSVTVALVMAGVAQPFSQLVGLESQDAFLARNLPNHSLVERLNQEGTDVRGVLLIGDRRAFYLNAPTWIDVSLEALETLGTAPDSEAARAYLDRLGVSHVLVSAPDIEWHVQFDPDNRIKAWWAGFERTSPEYLTVEERYYDLTLYRVSEPARPKPVDLSQQP